MGNSDSLSQGAIVRVRTRNWLVHQVDRSRGGTTVSLVCADDDAQGKELEVVWEPELDRSIVSEEAWKDIGRDGFDPPRHFAAYLNTARWNCVTATATDVWLADGSDFALGIHHR